MICTITQARSELKQQKDVDPYILNIPIPFLLQKYFLTWILNVNGALSKKLSLWAKNHSKTFKTNGGSI